MSLHSNSLYPQNGFCGLKPILFDNFIAIPALFSLMFVTYIFFHPLISTLRYFYVIGLSFVIAYNWTLVLVFKKSNLIFYLLTDDFSPYIFTVIIIYLEIFVSYYFVIIYFLFF